jgi:pSer/pThr/pTyr-binding forkhead associated (FHA) protein
MVHYYLSLATGNIVSMSYPNSTPFPDPGSSISSDFSSRTDMGLAEVLQLCCLGRRSGQITFHSGESQGFVFIQQGRVLHAACGYIEGEEAIYNMLGWPGGSFTLNEDTLPHKKTVTLTWEQLLFEGARRADEGISTQPSSPVITAEPVVSTRAQESQPKLIVNRPDLPPLTFELVQEYTHLGRAPGNEISLPYPSISSRHCIFILSGPDIVLRDLNSSNGTLINGEPINEVVLRPGDVIQTGVCEIKFEAGMKRPKLRAGANVPAPRSGQQPLKEVSQTTQIAHTTVKLPGARTAPRDGGTSAPLPKDDMAYVKGVASISYSDLAKPEPEKKNSKTLLIVIYAAVIIVAGAGIYFFILHK